MNEISLPVKRPNRLGADKRCLVVNSEVIKRNAAGKKMEDEQDVDLLPYVDYLRGIFIKIFLLNTRSLDLYLRFIITNPCCTYHGAHMLHCIRWEHRIYSNRCFHFPRNM